MSDPVNAQPDTDGSWAERNYRAVKTAVIIMSVLLVFGFVVVFVTIFARLSGTVEPDPPVAQSTVLPADAAALLGPESEVVSTTADGNRLALVLRRPTGLAIVVVDLRNGQIVSIVAPE